MADAVAAAAGQESHRSTTTPAPVPSCSGSVSVTVAAWFIGFAAREKTLPATTIKKDYDELVARAKNENACIPSFTREWVSTCILEEQIASSLIDGLSGKQSKRLRIDPSRSVEEVLDWYQTEIAHFNGEGQADKVQALTNSVCDFIQQKKAQLPEFPVKQLRGSLCGDCSPLSSLRINETPLRYKFSTEMLSNYTPSGVFSADIAVPSECSDLQLKDCDGAADAANNCLRVDASADLENRAPLLEKCQDPVYHCFKCDKDGSLLKCCLCSCSVHENCLGCSAYFHAGSFVCPSCIHKYVALLYEEEKEIYSSTKKKLAQATMNLNSYLGNIGKEQSELLMENCREAEGLIEAEDQMAEHIEVVDRNGLGAVMIGKGRATSSTCDDLAFDVEGGKEALPEDRNHGKITGSSGESKHEGSEPAESGKATSATHIDLAFDAEGGKEALPKDKNHEKIIGSSGQSKRGESKTAESWRATSSTRDDLAFEAEGGKEVLPEGKNHDNITGSSGESKRGESKPAESVNGAKHPKKLVEGICKEDAANYKRWRDAEVAALKEAVEKVQGSGDGPISWKQVHELCHGLIDQRRKPSHLKSKWTNIKKYGQ